MEKKDTVQSCSSVRAFLSVAWGAWFCLLTALHINCQHLTFVYISSLSNGSAQFNELSLSSLWGRPVLAVLYSLKFGQSHSENLFKLRPNCGQYWNHDYLTRLLVGNMIKVLFHNISNFKYQWNFPIIDTSANINSRLTNVRKRSSK